MWEFRITNIAGIRSAEVSVEPGLNVVQASNFKGKSSFMSAIRTVMGTSGFHGTTHPLTEGTADGSVVLDTETERHEVRLERTDSGTVARHGVPVLNTETDRICASLFAFLGEDNPIRARVRNGGDLTPLLQAPLDVEDIDEQIASRKREREATERRLREAEQAASNIPSVTEGITILEAELGELRDRREELSAEAGAVSATDTSSDDIADCRSQLETAERTISRLESRIERTEQRLSEKKAALEDIEVPDEPDVSADRSAKEDRIEEIALRIDLLESLHRTNQRVLEEGEVELVSSVDRSLVEDEVGCWVCGETTTREAVRSRLAAMQDRLQSLREERSTLREEIADIEARMEERAAQRRRKTELEDAVGELTAELDELRGDHQQAMERRDQLQAELDELEAAAAEAETEVQEELTDVKAAIRTHERELSEQRSRLETLEERRADAEGLAAETERLDEEIAELRSRKTEKQRELKEQFDAAMADVIDRFAPGFDGARLVLKTDQHNEVESFELVVARDGRETDIGTLSEGERELVGVIVALAGHRTFDVGDRVPLVFVDGISQLSASNLRRLTAYLADASEMLVMTAYPEAGEFDGTRISPETWKTISKRDPSTA